MKTMWEMVFVKQLNTTFTIGSLCETGTEHEYEVHEFSINIKPCLSVLSGFPEVLPCGAAEPAAAGGDRSGGGDASLHQRLARGPTLP